MRERIKRLSQWNVLVIASLILMLIVSACSDGGSKSGSDNGSGVTSGNTANTDELTAADTNKETVELVWYYPQPKAQPDLQAVNDEINKITKEKINATVKLQPIDFGSYEQKLNTVVAANEEFDIVWTSTWLFNWVQNQGKGAFVELDELMNKNAPDLFASMEKKFWDDAKIKGEIYAVPSYQISAKRPGLVIQKRFADKYNLDVQSIKKVEDIEPFLKQIKDNEPADIIPFGTTQGWFDPLYYGYDPVGVHKDDSSNKVVDTAFSPEYEQYVSMMHSWYTQGFINKDAATLKDMSTLNSKGTVAVSWDWTLKPGGETESKNAMGGQDVIYLPLTKPYFTGAASTMNAISRTSKHPDRAIQFLQLLNTDKTLYNLITYGIEGKHYTKVSDNVVKLNTEAGYFPNTDWVFGNVTNGYLPEGAPADKYEQTKQVNDEAFVSPYYGFVFNPEPVKTEIANIKAVTDEYLPGLNSGTVDPKQFLPKYRDKLKKAGVDKVVAETQKQLDEWMAKNGSK